MPANPSIFSTYRGGENRVTSSMLAVFQRVGIDLTEQILAAAIGEAALDLVTFASQPSKGAAGVPDAELKGSFHYLIETKVVPNVYRAARPSSQLERHLARLTGSHDDEKILVVTPDTDEPQGIAALRDDRVIWTSFALIAQAIEGLLHDPAEPASEQQRFLLRELITFFEAEGLLGVEDTVIVAGRFGYPEYLKVSAYICQANRAIRPVSRFGFYTQKEIKPELPRVIKHYPTVEFNEEAATLYEASDDPHDRRVGELIRWRLRGEQDPVNDIYLLTAPGDAETVMSVSVFD